MKSSVQMSAANLRRAFGDKKSAGSRTIITASGVSRVSRPKSTSHMTRSIRSVASFNQHKKRILEVVDNLNEEELEKVSEMLKDHELQ